MPVPVAVPVPVPVAAVTRKRERGAIARAGRGGDEQEDANNDHRCDATVECIYLALCGALSASLVCFVHGGVRQITQHKMYFLLLHHPPFALPLVILNFSALIFLHGAVRTEYERGERVKDGDSGGA